MFIGMQFFQIYHSNVWPFLFYEISTLLSLISEERIESDLYICNFYKHILKYNKYKLIDHHESVFPP